MKTILIFFFVIGVIIILFLIFRLREKYRTEIVEPIIEEANTIKEITNDNGFKNIIIEVSHRNNTYEFEVELFDNDLPITCKNFRHIAFDGLRQRTYVNSIFHRIIDDFMVQGGDILHNDGTGSICMYGKTFIDEGFKYSHDQPGLISMANSGEDSNGSQFFITLNKCTHLDNKHVVFGRIVRGLYNIFKLSKIDVDVDNKPIDNAVISKITAAE